VWIFLPQVREGSSQEETPEAFRAAEAAGFVVLDLSDVFKGQDLSSVRLAEWDDHPSAHGHELIASRLFTALLDKRETGAPGVSPPVSAASENPALRTPSMQATAR
jgi:hypothetical protein